MISDEAADAAAEVVLSGMDEGHHAYKIAYAALEAAAPHMLAGVLKLHAKRLGDYSDHDGIRWGGEHCGHCRVEWPCATIEVLPQPE